MPSDLRTVPSLPMEPEPLESAPKGLRPAPLRLLPKHSAASSTVDLLAGATDAGSPHQRGFILEYELMAGQDPSQIQGSQLRMHVSKLGPLVSKFEVLEAGKAGNPHKVRKRRSAIKSDKSSFIPLPTQAPTISRGAAANWPSHTQDASPGALNALGSPEGSRFGRRNKQSLLPTSVSHNPRAEQKSGGPSTPTEAYSRRESETFKSPGSRHRHGWTCEDVASPSLVKTPRSTSSRQGTFKSQNANMSLGISPKSLLDPLAFQVPRHVSSPKRTSPLKASRASPCRPQSQECSHHGLEPTGTITENAAAKQEPDRKSETDENPHRKPVIHGSKVNQRPSVADLRDSFEQAVKKSISVSGLAHSYTRPGRASDVETVDSLRPQVIESYCKRASNHKPANLEKDRWFKSERSVRDRFQSSLSTSRSLLNLNISKGASKNKTEEEAPHGPVLCPLRSLSSPESKSRRPAKVADLRKLFDHPVLKYPSSGRPRPPSPREMPEPGPDHTAVTFRQLAALSPTKAPRITAPELTTEITVDDFSCDFGPIPASKQPGTSEIGAPKSIHRNTQVQSSASRPDIQRGCADNSAPRGRSLESPLKNRIAHFESLDRQNSIVSARRTSAPSSPSPLSSDRHLHRKRGIQLWTRISNSMGHTKGRRTSGNPRGCQDSTLGLSNTEKAHGGPPLSNRAHTQTRPRRLSLFGYFFFRSSDYDAHGSDDSQSRASSFDENQRPVAASAETAVPMHSPSPKWSLEEIAISQTFPLLEYVPSNFRLDFSQFGLDGAGPSRPRRNETPSQSSMSVGRRRLSLGLEPTSGDPGALERLRDRQTSSREQRRRDRNEQKRQLREEKEQQKTSKEKGKGKGVEEERLVLPQDRSKHHTERTGRSGERRSPESEERRAVRPQDSRREVVDKISVPTSAFGKRMTDKSNRVTDIPQDHGKEQKPSRGLPSRMKRFTWSANSSAVPTMSVEENPSSKVTRMPLSEGAQVMEGGRQSTDKKLKKKKERHWEKKTDSGFVVCQSNIENIREPKPRRPGQVKKIVNMYKDKASSSGKLILGKLEGSTGCGNGC